MNSHARNDRNGWLRHALRQAKCTQRELAKLWGVTPAALNRWIAIGATLPVERAVILCHVLGWTLEDLFKAMNITVKTDLRLPPAPSSQLRDDQLELHRTPDGRMRLVANYIVTPRQAAPLLEVIRLARPIR